MGWYASHEHEGPREHNVHMNPSVHMTPQSPPYTHGTLTQHGTYTGHTRNTARAGGYAQCVGVRSREAHASVNTTTVKPCKTDITCVYVYAWACTCVRVVGGVTLSPTLRLLPQCDRSQSTCERVGTVNVNVSLSLGSALGGRCTRGMVRVT